MKYSSNPWGQVHRTDLHLPEFEVKFEHWNVLYEKYEVRTDYFRCSSKESVYNALAQKYGQLVDVISITEEQS